MLLFFNVCSGRVFIGVILLLDIYIVIGATGGTTINGWLRDYLWAQASQVIQSYGTTISRNNVQVYNVQQ